jgi:hypothetical protein
MRLCKAARAGVTEYLSTLPDFVVCGGYVRGVEYVSDVWRLHLATLRWEPMPALVAARIYPACCVVRGGALVVLGGVTREAGRTSSVEMLSPSEEGGAFADLPPLPRGGIGQASAVAVDESDSAAGQVLLLGGTGLSGFLAVTMVQPVDLATGACAPQDNLLHPHANPAAGRLPDRRIVCAGGLSGDASSAKVWGPPGQGAVEVAWSWRELPGMSVPRFFCRGCVMSDRRFAVLGGDFEGISSSSCEALSFDGGDAHWEPLSPMHDARASFACGAVAGCVIVAGGCGLKSAEWYDAELNRWLRFPCDLRK